MICNMHVQVCYKLPALLCMFALHFCQYINDHRQLSDYAGHHQLDVLFSVSLSTNFWNNNDVDCDDGWAEGVEGGVCYYLSPTPLSWADAVNACEDKAGRIVVAETGSVFTNATFDTFWVGVYDSWTPSGWEAVEPVTGLRELVKQHNTGPSESADKLCLSSHKQAYGKYQWTSTNCESRLNFICKKSARFWRMHTKESSLYAPVPYNSNSITNKQFVKFSYRGASDLNVLLQTRGNTAREGIYNIIICGWGNSKSVIRTKLTAPVVHYASLLSHLCSSGEFRPFWIAWTASTITVGRGNTLGESTFMTWRDPVADDMVVENVSVSSGPHNAGDWTFETIESEQGRTGEVNLALGKSVTQSSNYNRGHKADKAVDGCRTPTFGGNCCTHTGNDYQPYIQVDLGRVYPISKVVVYRRWEDTCAVCKRRLYNNRLFISLVANTADMADLVYQDTRQEPPAVIEIDVPKGKSGRYVKLDIADRNEYLTICELEVYEDLDTVACGVGWLDYQDNNTCFQFGEGDVTWFEARDRCTAAGAVLGLVESQAEQLFIYEKGHLFYTIEQSIAHAGNGLWLGMHVLDNTRTWTTVDGTPIVYTDWAEGEPNNYGNAEDCASFRLDSNRRTGKMNDSPCTRRMRYMCKRKEREPTTTTVTTSTQTPTMPTTTMKTTTTTIATTTVSSNVSSTVGVFGCRNPWVVEPTTQICYLVVKEINVDWHTAFRECQSRGSSLATVMSAKELNFVKGIIADAEITDTDEWTGLWIAGKDSSVEGIWKWQPDTVPWFTGIQWLDGQPSNTNNEDCAMMLTRHDRRGLLNDAPCSWQGGAGYLCKRHYGSSSGGPTTEISTRAATVIHVPTSPPIPTSTLSTKHQEGCPDGWLVGPNGFCYVVVYTKLNWHAAEFDCTTKGAHLASITTHAEQEFMQELSSGVTNSGLWVGAHDLVVEGTWTWSDTSAWWTGIDWASGNPDNWGDAGEDCGMVLSSSTRLNDAGCSIELPYICEKPAETSPSTPTRETGTTTTTVASTSVSTARTNVNCWPSWDDDPNSRFCYQFNSDLVSWRVAESRCVENGGHLVSITTPEEQYYISGRLQDKVPATGEVWIGANDHDLEGGWAWTDGMPFAYFNWANDEPNNYAGDNSEHVTGEDCGAMVTGSDDTAAMWNDMPCDYRRGYICKKLDMEAENTSAITTPTPQTDPSLVEIYQERRTGGVDYTSHDLQELAVASIHNISFNVKAANDAHVLLQHNKTEYTRKIVEIVIGGWANQKSVIRSRQQQDPPETLHVEAGLLSADEYRPFWISWDQGKIQVGKSDQFGQNTFMSWDGLKFGVNFISVGVGYGSDAHWQFTSGVKYYGCEGDGWVDYRHSCYLVVQQPAEWAAALKYCRKESADLAAIADADEQNFIFSQLPTDYCFNVWSNDTQCEMWAEKGECDKNPAWMARHCHQACNYCMHNCRDLHSPTQCTQWARTGECDLNHPWMIYNCAQSCGVCYGAPTRGFWIGMSNRRSSRRYTWSDNSGVTYTWWDAAEPNLYGNKGASCVALFLQTGRWNDGPCEDPLPGFVCEQPKLLLPTTTQSPFEVGCTMDNSFGYGIYCYTLISEQKSWKAAEGVCSRRGGNLAVISDRYIQSFISSELVNLLHDHWIGMSSNNGTMSWSSGDTVEFTYFVRTAAGNVNAPSSCLAMTTYRPVGLWKSYNCGTELPFVCQHMRDGYTKPSTTESTTSQAQCPSAWLGVGSFCYKGSDEKRTWSDARAQCQRYGAELGSIQSDMENDALVDLNGTSAVWIGLQDKDGDESYTWSDGTPSVYTHWAPGEPSELRSLEQCVQYNPTSGLWSIYNCYFAKRYVCKIPKGFEINTPAPTPVNTTQTVQCHGDPGWLYFQGNCYHANRSLAATWHDGRKYCMDNGGDLASIHSSEENNFMMSLVGAEESVAWIGLNDINMDASFKWSDGTASNYFSWGPGEPNDSYGAAMCAVLVTHNGKWNDNNCDQQRKIICKRQNDTSVTPTTSSPPHPVEGGCPANFVGFGNNCFFRSSNAVSDRKQWLAAKEACEALGVSSHLASVHSATEQAFLITQLKGLDSSFWIGLNDMDADNSYNWADNSVVDYTNWHQYEPSASYNTYTQEQCVEIYGQADKAGYWNNAKCRSIRGYICATPKASTLPNPTPATADTGCPTQYLKYGGYCYRLVSNATAWLEANFTCSREGGTLASIQDPFEQAFVQVLLSGRAAWIGLTVSQYGESNWSNGDGVGMTSWAAVPSVGDAGCTLQNGSAWELRTCSDRHRSVCKQAAVTTITTLSTTPTTSPLPKVCREPTWKLYRGNCYHIELHRKVAFATALQMCQDINMNLASIHSAEENKAIARILLVEIDRGDAAGYGAVWIGLLKKPFAAVSDQGTAAASVAWTDYSAFSYSALTDGGATSWREICVVMSPYNSLWTGAQCTRLHGYVCKAAADMTPEPTTSAPTASIGTSTTASSTAQTSSRASYPPTYVSATPGTAYTPVLPPFHHPLKADITVSEVDPMTGGQIAALVIGVLGALFIIAVVVYVVLSHWRRSKHYSPGSPSLGFDNALFHKTGESVALE